MTKHIRFAFILLAICALSAAALAITNAITAPVIEIQEEENRLAALKAVSSGFEIGDQEDIAGNAHVTFVIRLLDGERVGGYILGVKGAGYGGEMAIVASYTTEGEILRVQLLSHSETPGLGKKAENEGYMDKYEGTGASEPVPTNKSMLSSGDAAAVSGSTVTFTAIAKALEAGSVYAKELGGK